MLVNPRTLMGNKFNDKTCSYWNTMYQYKDLVKNLSTKIIFYGTNVRLHCKGLI